MATEYKAKSDELIRSDERENQLHNVVLFKLSLRSLSNITLILPLSGLFFCFVTGYIFQAEEIHETHCRVSIIVMKKLSETLNICFCWFSYELFMFFLNKIFLFQHNYCNLIGVTYNKNKQLIFECYL